MKPAVAAYQVPWEFQRMLAVLYSVERWPERVLEVGCYEGGTLWHWLRMARTVVAIDDVCRNADEWNTWAHEAGCDLHTLLGDSRDDEIVWSARERGPYDLVFIDADHTYDSVKADWLNYGSMLAEGGALAFHDILPRPGYGVSDVWAEVKAIDGVRWIEIAQNRVEPGNEGRCGIGVVWL